MIILVGGEKGGAGKSCLSQNLAVYLQTKNRDVLLLDADPQGTTTDWIKERDDNDDLKDILNEAAGVSRYHQQKNDALQRLERTSQSFEIFNTKLNELKKQSRHMKTTILFGDVICKLRFSFRCTNANTNRQANPLKDFIFHVKSIITNIM